MCGCQPLSSPDGPVTDVAEDITDLSRMSVLAAVAGTGPFTVDWGDGTKEDLASGLTGKTHRYKVVAVPVQGDSHADEPQDSHPAAPAAPGGKA